MTRAPALASLAVLAVLVTGCAGQGSGSDAGGATSSDMAPAPAAAPAEEAAGGSLLRDEALAFDADVAASRAVGGSPSVADVEVPAAARSLISTATIRLRSDDVADTRLDVLEVVDGLRGEVAQEETLTDDDGAVRRSRLVLRVPSADFAEAMAALEGTATLVESSSAVDDVTTKVIDTQVRLQVQRASIRRITLLLARAESIRDIVAIESQLSRRQADLGSLERTAAYLADQTSQATITVALVRTDEEPAEEQEETGFLAGLDAGWSAFTSALVGLATATGAALPFAVVLLLLGWPALVVLRRVRRGRTARTPSAA